MTTPLELVVRDMAGTTVLDDGVVEQAFQRAAARMGVAGRMPWEEALDYVRATMGQVQDRCLYPPRRWRPCGCRTRRRCVRECIRRDRRRAGVSEIPGAADAIQGLKDAGLAVALTTGFVPITCDVLLDGLGWRGLVDLALSLADAGRGRPTPDLVLTALIRTWTSRVSAAAVVGDTVSDVESGRRAGACLVAGVLSGAYDRPALSGAGANVVLDDVTGLFAVLAERELLPAAAVSGERCPKWARR